MGKPNKRIPELPEFPEDEEVDQVNDWLAIYRNADDITYYGPVSLVGGGGGTEVDLHVYMGFFAEGDITADRTIYMIGPENCTLPAGLTGSYVKAGTAATAEVVVVLADENGNFGTATFGAGGSTATVTSSSARTIAAGEKVRAIFPAEADATLADVTGVLKADPA